MTLSRRKFLGFGSLLLAACSPRKLAACDTTNYAAPTPHTTSYAAPTPHVELDEEPPAQCTGPTATNIEGPFYKKGAPHRAELADDKEPGERFLVTGVVQTSDCKPLANAEIDIWHADARGGYDLDGYHLRGKLVTDAKGRFELRTIVPGRYLNGDQYRPAHIHVKVRAAGHRVLTTQLYFEGDPYNDVDPFIVSSLIMKHSKGRARFDFTLVAA